MGLNGFRPDDWDILHFWGVAQCIALQTCISALLNLPEGFDFGLGPSQAARYWHCCRGIGMSGCILGDVNDIPSI